MNAAVMQNPMPQIGAGMTSAQDWVQCDETFSMKVLSVDEARHSAEVLFRIRGPYRSGNHKHLCETHAFVIDGGLVNHTAGCQFGPGDYCYQPLDDVHDEEFPAGDTVVYVSYRGYQDTLVEFYDDDGAVCGTFKVSDFSAGLHR